MKTKIKSRAPLPSTGNEAQEGAAQGSPVSDDNEAAGEASRGSDHLTEREQSDFDRHCARLKQIENTWMEFGEALLEIRDQRLYRGEYESFEAFCRKELATGKSNVNRRLQCTQIAKLVATNVAIPLLEGHVRPLLRLNDPVEQVQAFQQAVDQAKEKKKPLTAVFVTRAVRKILDDGKPGQVDHGPTKSGVITQIHRDLTRGLESRPLEQLQEFATALGDFKESWLKAHPSPDEPAPTNDRGQSK